MPSHAGIQWKKLFLPNGTVLRTVFRGKNHHCRVEEDRLLHEGKPTSPNGFANLVGGIRRNAWKVIWILFPQAQNWQLADDLRPERVARPVRSSRQASRAGPGGGETTGPASPERASAPCCRCAAQDSEQLEVDVRAACPARTHAARREQLVFEQNHLRQQSQRQRERGQQVPDRAPRYAEDNLEQQSPCKVQRAQQQAQLVRPHGGRTDFDRPNEARRGAIDRRQRGARRRRQSWAEAQFLNLDQERGVDWCGGKAADVM